MLFDSKLLLRFRCQPARLNAVLTSLPKVAQSRHVQRTVLGKSLKRRLNSRPERPKRILVMKEKGGNGRFPVFRTIVEFPGDAAFSMLPFALICRVHRPKNLDGGPEAN